MDNGLINGAYKWMQIKPSTSSSQKPAHHRLHPDITIPKTPIKLGKSVKFLGMRFSSMHFQLERT